jgi:hypothetical protein
MMHSIFRNLVLPLVLGAAIMLVVVTVCRGLDVLLADRADYDRGLWEGAAIMLIMRDGFKLAHRVLGFVDARKKARV